jgi:hypothetical protein
VAYIGVSPTKGNWRKLTDISGSFNGVTTSFTLSVPPGGSSYYVTPASPYQLLISLGGVIQQPDIDYTVSTNTITFTTAPASGLSFFGILAGDALNIGTPSDNTVTAAKLNGTGGLVGQTFVLNSSGQFTFGYAGATGGTGNQVFYENDQTITANYTITTNKNAMTAGPVTINSGVTVVVPSGSSWTIV